MLTTRSSLMRRGISLGVGGWALYSLHDLQLVHHSSMKDDITFHKSLSNSRRIGQSAVQN